MQPVVCNCFADGSTADRMAFGAACVMGGVEVQVGFGGTIKGSGAAELVGAWLGMHVIHRRMHEHRQHRLSSSYRLLLDSLNTVNYLHGGKIGEPEGTKLLPLISLCKAFLAQLQGWLGGGRARGPSLQHTRRSVGKRQQERRLGGAHSSRLR